MDYNGRPPREPHLRARWEQGKKVLEDLMQNIKDEIVFFDPPCVLPKPTKRTILAINPKTEIVHVEGLDGKVYEAHLCLTEDLNAMLYTPEHTNTKESDTHVNLNDFAVAMSGGKQAWWEAPGTIGELKTVTNSVAEHAQLPRTPVSAEGQAFADLIRKNNAGR